MKHFVLDTNVLLHDPRAILSFADNEVVIPIYVIEEIDHFKKELSERGRNAREVARRLDEFRDKGARLSDGVDAAERAARLRVASRRETLPRRCARAQIADNYILAVALEVRDTTSASPTILVTKDVNLRIRADALGLTLEEYDAERIDVEELYSGNGELKSPRRRRRRSSTRRARCDHAEARRFKRQPVPPPARSREPVAHRARPLRRRRASRWCRSRSCAKASGESARATRSSTTRSISCSTTTSSWSRWSARPAPARRCWPSPPACRRCVEEGVYQKLLVSRPIFPLGKDIGYLPGDIEEKLNPWMQPIYDNVELLLGLSKAEQERGPQHQELIDLGYIEIEPLTYIRGRSIPNQYMIVDEAQNLTPHEVKTIITRVGESTKIMLTGDPYQIDNPYVDATSNGLTTVVERFKGEPMAGHVTLSKGERSPLAELASNIL